MIGHAQSAQQRAEHQCFNRRVQVILGGKEIPGKLKNESSLCRSFCSPKQSVEF
jgi:hypothetical protein